MTIGGGVGGSLVLFDGSAGGDVTAVTGGWQATRANVSASRIQVTYAREDGRDIGGFAYPRNVFDLSKYRYCHAVVSYNNQNKGHFGVRNASGTVLAGTTVTGTGIFDVNISGITESGRPYFNTDGSNASNLQVTKVWFDNKPTA